MTDLQILRAMAKLPYKLRLNAELLALANRTVVVEEGKKRGRYAKTRQKKCAKCKKLFPDSRKLIKPYPESNNAYCEACFSTLRKRRTKKEIQKCMKK